ncbi:MAG TPA: 3-oxoacyl-[acyl-carrier-protein] synthase III C-terminal domain-containing protein [Mycobacterium sp.]|nr:3-oxoacyl-[acyl-carrier-protein] synthase III C-terminal domain-containing protein [Mycobacterium sp.]
MGTVIDRLDVTRGGWRTHHSALRLAVAAAKTCLERAGRDPDDVDLLVNAGIYRDRNLAEPALAALIQEDVGANAEDPHADAHGTFSFDITNGTCGVLTALQIVDGFLRSHTINWGLVVTSDADPGHGMSEQFPFSPVGAALLCEWTDDDYGLGRVHWANFPDDGENFCATVGFEDARNVLRFRKSTTMDEQLAAAGAQVARSCLQEASLGLADVDVIVAAPARHGYRAALATHLGVPVDRITVADDERMHTASLVAALHCAAKELPSGARVLLIAAGAGVTAGAALYREAPAGALGPSGR